MRNLTVRGRAFLAAGLAAVVCGIQVGERDFVRIGLVAALVPLLAWLLLRRTDREVWVRRSVSAVQVEAGDTAHVELELGNAGRRTGLMLVQEQLPEALGPPRRFVLDPLAAGASTTLRYPIHAEHRGRYPIGPLHVRVGDPVGMVEIGQELPATASILVTPSTETLPRVPLTGRWAGAGDDRTRELLGGGSPDVATREYRMGDDLRRIHWPTSARTDELMVRREEQEWQSRCTLLVDDRRGAHRGHGHQSSMETAVRAAASIMRHLAAQDFEVRLVTATGESAAHGWRQGSRAVSLPQQLEQLALMRQARSNRIATGWVDESQHGGMIVAVLGHLDEADRRLLSGFAAAGDAAYAVVLDVAGWDRTGPQQPPATAALRSGGWKASTLTRDGSLPSAWLEMAR